MFGEVFSIWTHYTAHATVRGCTCAASSLFP